MEQHPRIVFRSGPGGRRAGLIGGPDVWEVVGALRGADDGDADSLASIGERTGLTADQMGAALRYYADYTDEIGDWIRRVEEEAEPSRGPMATGARAARQVKLLLDEMWPPAIAEALRDRGHEAVAVAERRELRGMPDEAIFEEARAECWVIVTENVVDYRPLAAAAMRAGRAYPALIFTSNRAYPRANRRTAGRLVAALDALLTTRDAIDGEHWLG